jgi:hypothetical protein
MVKHRIVNRLAKVVPPNGVYEGCMLGKHHQVASEIGKYQRGMTRLELVNNGLCSLKTPHWLVQGMS